MSLEELSTYVGFGLFVVTFVNWYLAYRAYRKGDDRDFMFWGFMAIMTGMVASA